jgi:DNA-binding HxlR family transcriptional regulator
MTSKTYNLFCPLAMACEVVEPRWTLLILLEMWNGSTRFNELRRGVPGISPTLLSKRLREMEAQGLIERLEDTAKGTVDYVRTPMAIELEPAMDHLGAWAYRHMRVDVEPRRLNTDYLMWNLRRKVDQTLLPKRRVVVRFHFTDRKKDQATYWMIAKPGMAVDLCKTNPNFEVDLFIEADSKALAGIWMGYTDWNTEITRESVFLSGDPMLTRTIDKWLVECGYVNSADTHAVPV